MIHEPFSPANPSTTPAATQLPPPAPAGQLTPTPDVTGAPSKSGQLLTGAGVFLAGLATSWFGIFFGDRVESNNQLHQATAAAHSSFLAELGTISSKIINDQPVSKADLSETYTALQTVQVYGSGDATLHALSAYNNLYRAIDDGGNSSKAWRHFTRNKSQYINQLRDDLGVGDMRWENVDI